MKHPDPDLDLEAKGCFSASKEEYHLHALLHYIKVLGSQPIEPKYLMIFLIWPRPQGMHPVLANCQTLI